MLALLQSESNRDVRREDFHNYFFRSVSVVLLALFATSGAADTKSNRHHVAEARFMFKVASILS